MILSWIKVPQKLKWEVLQADRRPQTLDNIQHYLTLLNTTCPTLISNLTQEPDHASSSTSLWLSSRDSTPYSSSQPVLLYFIDNFIDL